MVEKVNVGNPPQTSVRPEGVRNDTPRPIIPDPARQQTMAPGVAASNKNDPLPTVTAGSPPSPMPPEQKTPEQLAGKENTPADKKEENERILAHAGHEQVLAQNAAAAGQVSTEGTPGPGKEVEKLPPLVADVPVMPEGAQKSTLLAGSESPPKLASDPEVPSLTEEGIKEKEGRAVALKEEDQKSFEGFRSMSKDQKVVFLRMFGLMMSLQREPKAASSFSAMADLAASGQSVDEDMAKVVRDIGSLRGINWSQVRKDLHEKRDRVAKKGK